MTPIEASKNELSVYKNMAGKRWKKAKFKVGDKVRIAKKKVRFDKGYATRWTREIFIIEKKF